MAGLACLFELALECSDRPPERVAQRHAPAIEAAQFLRAECGAPARRVLRGDIALDSHEPLALRPLALHRFGGVCDAATPTIRLARLGAGPLRFGPAARAPELIALRLERLRQRFARVPPGPPRCTFLEE
jgi:hypothetical protein